MKELDGGILYIVLHNILRKKCIKKGGNNKKEMMITKKEMFSILGESFHIPKNLRAVIIKEMEQRNLIRIDNNIHVYILDIKLDVEEDLPKFYKKVGLFGY